MIQRTQKDIRWDHLKYLAGASTAGSDRHRGMTLTNMQKVPQASDDKDWVRGYRDRLKFYLDENQ